MEHINYAVIKIHFFFGGKLSNHYSWWAGELVIHHCKSCKKLSYPYHVKNILWFIVYMQGSRV